MSRLDPSFVFRPDIFLRACWRKARERPERCLARAAWGDWLEVEPRRFIGSNIYMRGVHELAVCEVLWRLAEPGERAVDMGANIGVMTSVLSKRVGPSGRVTSFEAHPEVFRQLARNVGRWEGRRIEVVERAATWQARTVWMEEGDWFGVNEGTARIEGGKGIEDENDCFAADGGTAKIEDEEENEEEDDCWAADVSHPLPLLTHQKRATKSYQVEGMRLDEAIEGCDVLKIDVEGHEYEALLGAERLLETGGVRDIVYESDRANRGRTHELLREFGYEVFELGGGMLGPALKESAESRVQSAKCKGDSPARGGEGRRDYLGTRDGERARRRIRGRGWQVLWGARIEN